MKNFNFELFIEIVERIVIKFFSCLLRLNIHNSLLFSPIGPSSIQCGFTWILNVGLCHFSQQMAKLINSIK